MNRNSCSGSVLVAVGVVVLVGGAGVAHQLRGSRALHLERLHPTLEFTGKTPRFELGVWKDGMVRPISTLRGGGAIPQ